MGTRIIHDELKAGEKAPVVAENSHTDGTASGEKKWEKAQQGGELDVPDALCCTICMERRRTRMILPCHHFALCYECSRRPELNGKCPICTGKIERVVAVLLA